MSIILNGTTGITTPGIINTGTFTFQGVVELPAGSNSAPSLTTTGDTNTGIYFPAADQVAITTGGTQRLIVDASGNLGLGVTPTNNTLGKSIQNGQASAWVSETGSNRFWLGTNWYFDGTDKYIGTGHATLYSQQTGQHLWLTSASGTANNNITFTQALTLNANGALVLQGGDTGANGVGITFPATQSASSNANTLDDYEEGAFTPTAVCTGQTITYTIQGGSYTKIGNIVRVQINIVINTVSGAAGGNTTISGLPFSNGDTTYSGQAVIGYNDGFANTIYAAWITGTDMLFRSGTRSSGNDAGGFTAGGYIYINAVYRV